MKQPDEYYQGLILDYFTGNLENEKFQELSEWVYADKCHQQFFREEIKKYNYIQASGQWDTIDAVHAREQVFHKLHHPRRLFRYTAYAACLTVLLTATFFIYQYREKSRIRNDFPEYASSISPVERHKALLSIGKERPIRIEGKEKIILPANQGNRILLADSNIIDYSQLTNQPGEQVQLHTLEVPQGCEFNVILSDGTHIWMNAGSMLTYPEHFGGNSRQVQLTGEAYFEVTPDPEAPFIVNTTEMELTVLGTSFNIKAYREDNEVVTTLATGKIRQTYKTTGEKLLLSPLQQAVYSKKAHSLRVQPADMHEALAWKEGRIVLKNKTLEEIFNELARWYDFDVDYRQEGLKNTRFYVNMNRYDDIRSVLEKLQRTNGIRFSFKGRKITVY